MRVLLTGANGYLGRHILDFLAHEKNITVFATSHSENHNKNVIMCDLLNLDKVQELYRQVNPDIIIHTAAIVPKNLDDYHDTTSQILNLQMIDNLCHNFSGKFVFCSSMTVYSENQTMPVHEDSVSEAKNLSPYGSAKYQAEQKILLNKAIKPLILRFPGLYGGNRQRGLVYNLIKHYKYGTDVHLPDKPIMWACMNVHDVALCIIRLALKHNIHTLLNISYDTVYSINRLVNMVADIAHKKQIQTIQYPDFQMNLSRLCAEIPDFNPILKENIKEFYDLC